MVGINFFIVPATVAAIAVDHRLRVKIRLMSADRVKHRMTPGKMFFRQIAAVGTRIGDQFMRFIQPLADIQHLLRTQVETFGSLNLQRRERKRQRSGI
ncbi:hypothetical protein D3C79_789050 [compost metagenome]